MEVPRERKRVRDPDAWIKELGPGGLDHGLEPRASARSRFGDFRAFEAEVLPAGSAQPRIVPPFRVRNKQRACCPRGAISYELTEESAPVRGGRFMAAVVVGWV
jgi:hypothetical protein